MDATIGIGDLEQAINRARAASPSAGGESALTLEVSTLAALYGRLIYERRETVEVPGLTAAERVALRLWSPRRAASLANG